MDMLMIPYKELEGMYGLSRYKRSQIKTQSLFLCETRTWC